MGSLPYPSPLTLIITAMNTTGTTMAMTVRELIEELGKAHDPAFLVYVQDDVNGEYYSIENVDFIMDDTDSVKLIFRSDYF
jgi:uracil phosphoribosyltransferase